MECCFRVQHLWRLKIDLGMEVLKSGSIGRYMIIYEILLSLNKETEGMSLD